MTDKLLPCPFCGSEAKLFELNYSVGIRCQNKDCSIAIEAFKKDFVIKQWNTRHESAKTGVEEIITTVMGVLDKHNGHEGVYTVEFERDVTTALQKLLEK